MRDSLAGIALGAGAGTRMRPLSLLRPKVMCPVGDLPLIDHALARLATVTDAPAINAHESQPSLVAHVDGRAHVSVEAGEPLGTAGAVAALADWIDGRPTVVVNGDTWCPGGLSHLVEGWDGTSIRLLTPDPGQFTATSVVLGALMSWADVERLQPEPSGLWEVSWEEAVAAGRAETVVHDGPFVTCDDVVDYLEANLACAGGSVIGEGARVEGTVVDSVVWPGAVVEDGERLERAIRTDAGTTVLVRRRPPDLSGVSAGSAAGG